MPILDKRYIRLFTLVSVAFMASCFSACHKKANVDQAPNVHQTSVAKPAPTPEEIVKEKPVYVYSGDKYRDPFSPAGQVTSYQPNATFDPKRTAVKGIIYSKGIKTAVLSVSGGGSYFIKMGIVFDIMGKIVKGYTAQIFEDKVVIIGDADNVYEIKIKNSEGGSSEKEDKKS